MLKKVALGTLCAATLASATACKKESPNPTAEGTAGQAIARVLGAKVKSVGRQHLPAGCEMVISLDWQRFRELPSVKGNIDSELAKFEAPPVPNAPIDPEVAADIKKFKEFLAKTQIDLRTDPGEIAVCVWKLAALDGNTTPPFVGVLGGNFIPGAAADAFDTFSERVRAILNRARPGAPKTPPPEIIEIGGVKVAYNKAEGIYLGQAKDGAFVVGNDRPSFEKALGTSDAHLAYKLPAEPASVTLTQAAAPLLAPRLAQSPLAPAASAFAGGNLSLQEGWLRLEIQVTDAKVLAPTKANLDMLIQPNPAIPPNPFTAALAGAKVTTAESSLTLLVPLPEDMTQDVLQQAGLAPARPRPLIVQPGGLPPGALPPGALPPGAQPPAPKKPAATPAPQP